MQLPDWGSSGRWAPVLDSGRPAPFDFLVADSMLDQVSGGGRGPLLPPGCLQGGPSHPQASLDAHLASLSSWLSERQYPMLPYSCCVLEWRAEEPAAQQQGEEGKALLADWEGEPPLLYLWLIHLRP